MQFETVTIVGVGLIGASIGLSLRKHQLARRVIGVGRKGSTLAIAQNRGAIDFGTTNIAEVLGQSNALIFCTPVDRIASQILDLAPQMKPGTWVTDAGSTKAKIVEQVEASLPVGIQFIGSHPLAGSEKSGPEAAKSDLFENRHVIITPTSKTNPNAIENAYLFWQSLGSTVTSLSPDEHDQILGLTSHLPHCVASNLAKMLPESWQKFAASGFRDTTRIASGEPELWASIFLANREVILHTLDQWNDSLLIFRDALLAKDAARLSDWLQQGKQVRDALGN